MMMGMLGEGGGVIVCLIEKVKFFEDMIEVE